MKSRRIVFLSSSVGSGGGAERSLVHLIEAAAAAGFPATLITPGPGLVPELVREHRILCDVAYWPGLPSRLRTRDGSLPVRIANVAANTTRAVRAGWQLGRAFGPPVGLIHCNNLMPNVVGTLAGAVGQTPIVWHARDIHTRLVRRASYRLLARHPAVRRIICVSQTAAQQYRGVAASKVRVVHNGIDSAEWYRPAVQPTLRADYPALRDRFVIGCHGRLVPWKGFETAIEATRQVVDRLADAALVIIGDADPGIRSETRYKARLRAMIERLGLENHVYLTGFRSDVRPYLADLDVYVIPSREPDPFPRAVLEAMAMGLPIVGSDTGGISEALSGESRRSGILVPPGDAVALATALFELRKDPALGTRLGNAAAEAVRTRFTLDAYCRGSLAVFGEVLENSGAS